MRLHKLRTYYPGYVDRFYGDRPGLEEQPYEAQFRELMADCFAASDFWAKALAPHGYETFETIANVEPLQRRWAEENGADAGERDGLLEIAARQVRQFAPTVLFVVDYVTFDRAFLERLRAENPTIRAILGWCGAAYGDASVFSAYDVVLSCVPELVQAFTSQGHRAVHVDHAFAPEILTRIDTARAPTTDFSFVGSVVKGKGFHNERERLLLQLIESTELQIFSDLPDGATRPRAPRLRRLLPGSNGGVDPRLAARARPALWGRAMYQQLHDSRLALNTHIDVSPLSASNMRLFETTGVGSCLVTEWRDNLPELLDPDREVVTYRGAHECAEKVEYLLTHEEERRAIAEAGQRRTLREHTYDRWAHAMDEIVREVTSHASR